MCWPSWPAPSSSFRILIASTTTFASKAARFDLGRVREGKSKSVRFDRQSSACSAKFIPTNAFILVAAHPFFAMTDTDGRIESTFQPAPTCRA
jgi:hypothetical protein